MRQLNSMLMKGNAWPAEQANWLIDAIVNGTDFESLAMYDLEKASVMYYGGLKIPGPDARRWW